MGVNCFKEDQGALLPADSHSDDGREELERQEAVLHKQETELTEKQSRYLALLSQLEEEKTRVAAARKDLTEALSESEIFKSTIKELSTRLRECEAAVSQLKGSQDEHERLTQSIATIESQSAENSLQAELATTQQQVISASAELDIAKGELEAQQRKLRKTEASIQLLEKLELEMESELGEEVSKHEGARRKAYLRGLFLFALRRIHTVRLKGLLVWRSKAKSLAVKREERFCHELENLRLKIEKVPQIDSAEVEALVQSGLRSCSTLRALRPQLESGFSRLAPAQETIAYIKGLTQAALPGLQQLYDNDEAELIQAAESEACRTNLDKLLSHLSDLEEVPTVYERIQQLFAEASSLHKLCGQRLVDFLTTIEDATQLLESIEDEITRLLDVAHPLPSDTQHCAQALLRETRDRKQTAGAKSEFAAEESDRVRSCGSELRETGELLKRCLKESLLETIAQLQLLQASALQTVELRAKEKEEVVEESAAVSELQETEVASAAPEDMKRGRQVSVLLPNLDHLLPLEAEEIKNSPTLKVLLSSPQSESELLSQERLVEVLDGFLASVTTAHPSPRISVSLIEYLSLSHPRHEVCTELATLAGTLSSLESPYYSLLSSALGLSLSTPISDLKAKALILAEIAVHQESARVEKSRQSSAHDLQMHGGKVLLIDAIKALYHLFATSSTLGEVALETLRPPEMPLVDYLTFLTCARIKATQKDSSQLFKLLDEDDSGHLDCQKFVAGLRTHLNLWVSAENVTVLYGLLNKEGSGNMSHGEFARELNDEEYFGKEQEYCVTKRQVLEAVERTVQTWSDSVLRPVQGKTTSDTHLLIEPLSLPQDYVEQLLSDLGVATQAEDVMQYLLAHPPPSSAVIRNCYPEKFAIHSDDLLSVATRELLQTLDEVTMRVV